MMNYKIGDRVRILNTDAEDAPSETIGMTGEITHVETGMNADCYSVKFNQDVDGDDFWFYKDSEIKLSSEEDDGFEGLESEDLITIINDGRSQLRELTETLESQTRSLASERAQLELKSEEISDLNANAKAAKCAIGDLDEKIRGLESTLADQSKLLEEQRLKINAEDEEARKADECTTRLAEQNATISKLEESHERLKSQNDGLVRECQKLTNCVIGGAMTQFLVTQGVGQ